jgi:Helicase HerA, central domain
VRWPFRRAPRVSLGTIGRAPFSRPFSLSLSEARTHAHVLGKSGSGKSYWLTSWARALMRSGHGVIFLDPHGDTARLILAHLAADGFFDHPDAFEKLLYLDIPTAARRGRYLPLNWLRQPRFGPHALASNIKEAFHRAYPELATGAAMFDTLVQDGVKVLIGNGLPLTRLYRLLTDKGYRDQLLTREDDRDVLAFWHDQFDRLKPNEQAEAAGAALRRAHLLTFNPVLKHSLGADDLVLSFRELLDAGTSVLVNLATEDDETRRLLGCLLTVFAEQGALSRLDLPPGSRLKTSFLVIDEFSSFSAGSAEALSTMLSQSRKVGLFAGLSHQNWTQASERLRGALENVGLEVTFQTGRSDAERSARIVGHVDPDRIKRQEPVWFSQRGEPTVIDYRAQEEGLATQWERWVQRLTDLPRGTAYVKTGHGRAVRIQSPHLPAPRVDPDRLAAIEERYLTALFRSPDPPIPAAPSSEPTVVFGASAPRWSRPVLKRWH